LEQLKVTRIVIAHRLSTIIHADQIIVLRDGKVEQMGNYETLVVQPGLFADLARRQMA
jgi:ATP-binding cassette subfamily C protein